MSTFSLYPELLLLAVPLHLPLLPFPTPRTQTGEEPHFAFRGPDPKGRERSERAARRVLSDVSSYLVEIAVGV